MEKILFISGSARNGNCKIILEDLQSRFWSDVRTEVIYLRDFNLTPCLGCKTCTSDEHSNCVRGDKIDLILDKLVEADIIVLATPSYFYNVSSLTKNFIDKTNPFYDTRKLSGKKFIYIYTGGDTATTTKKYLDNCMYGFTICHGIKVLGSYAFSAHEIGEFKNEAEKKDTLETITRIIRENITIE